MTDAVRDGEATDAAQVLARVVSSWNEPKDLIDLRDGLGVICRHRTSGRLREANLGLLVQLIDGTGHIPSTADYDRLRAERAELGEQWPDRTTLARAWGHWLKAIRAAMTLFHLGGRGNVSADNHHLRQPPRTYSRKEAAAAIKQCRDALKPWPKDVWPTQWEYLTWVQLSRGAARHAGQPYPRLPGMSPLARLHGDYPAAVKYAAALAGGRPKMLAAPVKRKAAAHGTLTRYARGCRCEPCRHAKRASRIPRRNQKE